MKKIAKQIKKILAPHFGDCVDCIEWTRKHIRIRLKNGRYVIRSKTPSDKNADWGMIRDVRRELAFNA